MPDATDRRPRVRPKLPQPGSDRSFGLAFDGIPLVDEGATHESIVPADGALGTTWTQTGFSPGRLDLRQHRYRLRATDSRHDRTRCALERHRSSTSGATPTRRSPETMWLSEVVEVHPVCNFFDTGGDGHFGNNLVFPGGGGDDYTARGHRHDHHPDQRDSGPSGSTRMMAGASASTAST